MLKKSNIPSIYEGGSMKKAKGKTKAKKVVAKKGAKKPSKLKQYAAAM